ncbi:MAG: glutamyl-tRNA(Gln) amidotransferase subunit D [Promethearchaeota archaeon CR_4]|nr:MAG: glutamyl-tRNA(Gln) amidotransferase subunit D [Candidatus Lokiarchaeota archaeon CR_4]
MSGNELEGYSGAAKELLQKTGAGVWSIVKVKTLKGDFEGIVLPRNKFAAPGFLEIKMKNGYNMGIEVNENTTIEIIGKQEAKYQIPEKKFPKDPKKPNVMLLGTGGTVASRLDYTTGGVIPAFTPGELFSSVPELANVCNLDTEIVFKIFSEDMQPQYWGQLASKVAEASKKKYKGVIIGHGTDTMSFTAAALSFMLPNLSIPVVLVGSQRSSDRPSSDAAPNLIHAAQLAARAPFAEVVVSMLGSPSHTYGLAHRGTRVRKMHSSVRHTFRTIGDLPLAKVDGDEITIIKKDYRPRSNKPTTADTKLEEKVGLVYAYPGVNPAIFDFYINNGYKGLVLAGTGLGHFPHRCFPKIKEANDAGITLVMSLQTLWGFTGMDVYETGREEQAIGIIPGGSMLPEVATVKLMWVLGHEKDPEKIRTLLQTNIAGEMLAGEPPNGFLVLQGVEPGIDGVLKPR